MPHRLYAVVARRARHHCEYCRAPEAVYNLEFEVEHIRPRGEGGTDGLDNLALACRSCNLHKGRAQLARDPTTGEASLLFNPRSDSWGEHFQIDLETFRVEGRTSGGRATVRRLGMNRPQAVQGRRLWVTRLLPDL